MEKEEAQNLCVCEDGDTSAAEVVTINTCEDENVNCEDANRETARKQMVATAISMLMGSPLLVGDDEEERLITEEISSDIILLLREKNRRNCVQNYLELTVPTYTDQEFRMHFRISRSLFESLSRRFFLSDSYQSLRADKRLSEDTHLLVFLWFAGHEACIYRDLGDRFNLCLASVGNIIDRVTLFISSMSPEVIKWPTEEQKRESSEFFNRKCYFSKAISCIDGTHIQIDPPKRSKDDYINRKGITSICLQAICNGRKKCVNTRGIHGSSQDIWVLLNSTIYDELFE